MEKNYKLLSDKHQSFMDWKIFPPRAGQYDDHDLPLGMSYMDKEMTTVSTFRSLYKPT